MKTMSVAELKAKFSEVLSQIATDGEPVAISYGRSRQTVAAIVPWSMLAPEGMRPLGVLRGRASCTFHGDFSVSDSDLLDH